MLNHEFDHVISGTVADVSKVIGSSADDRVWPLFKLQSENQDGLVSTPVAIELMPRTGDELPSVTHSFHPVTFARAKERDLFLENTGLDAYPDISDSLFPLRENHTTYGDDATIVYGSAETNIAVKFAGETEPRFLILLRDDMAKAYPDCFTSPGGMLDRTPATGGLKEFNEEMALIFKHPCGKFFHLVPDYQGQTGITSAEMRERSAPLLIERLKGQFGNIFGALTPDQLADMPVTLDHNPTFTPFETSVTITHDDLLYNERHSVIYDTRIKAISFQQNLLLPQRAADGTPLDNLVWGENFFAIDRESPHFKRDAFAMSMAEMLYARYPEGKDTPRNEVRGVLPVYGALINVLQSVTLVAEELGIKPTKSLTRWQEGRAVEEIFVRNPSASGGAYLLTPKANQFNYG